MLIDTHAHLNFSAYKEDFDEVIKRSIDNGVWMINIGSQYTSSERAVEIAKKYDYGVYAAIGLHPIHLETGLVKIKIDPEEIEFKTREEEFDYEKYKNLAFGKNLDSFGIKNLAFGKNLDSFGIKNLIPYGIGKNLDSFGIKNLIPYGIGKNLDFFGNKKLAQSTKVVAIGEIGLDYYYKPKTKTKMEIFKEKQRSSLYQQLKLAKELNLPVIFHCRFAHDDLIEILKSQTTNYKQISNFPNEVGLSCSPSRPSEMGSLCSPSHGAGRASKLQGVVHSFTGTWPQAEKYLEIGLYLGFNGIIFKLDLDEIIKKMPLERILLETDCPYLTPPPITGRNEPLYLKQIAEKIAKIKNVSFETIAETTTQNAKNLFKF